MIVLNPSNIVGVEEVEMTHSCTWGGNVFLFVTMTLMR